MPSLWPKPGSNSIHWLLIILGYKIGNKLGDRLKIKNKLGLSYEKQMGIDLVIGQDLALDKFLKVNDPNDDTTLIGRVSMVEIG